MRSARSGSVVKRGMTAGNEGSLSKSPKWSLAPSSNPPSAGSDSKIPKSYWIGCRGAEGVVRREQ